MTPCAVRYKVFVSSTSQDLQAERQALKSALESMEDVEFVGMERWGADARPPLAAFAGRRQGVRPGRRGELGDALVVGYLSVLYGVVRAKSRLFSENGDVRPVQSRPRPRLGPAWMGDSEGGRRWHSPSLTP